MVTISTITKSILVEAGNEILKNSRKVVKTKRTLRKEQEQGSTGGP